MGFMMRQVGRLLAGSMVICAIALLGGRVWSAGYACVRYANAWIPQNGLLDTRTGGHYNVVSTFSPLGPVYDYSQSPDGNFLAFAAIAGVAQTGMPTGYRVMLTPIMGTSERVLSDNLPNTNYSFRFEWSPDSQLIAYSWMNVAGRRSHMMVSKVTGETLSTEVADIPDLKIDGFSPDGRYLVTVNESSLPLHVLIWEPDWANRRLTLKLRYTLPYNANLAYPSGYYASGLPGYIASDHIVWSPSGTWLALVSLAERTNQVVLLSPDTQQTVIKPVSWLPYSPQVAWSPDEQYVALQSLPDPNFADRYRLAVFAVADRPMLDVSANVTGTQPMHWSPDSQALYFADAPQPGLLDLMKVALPAGQLTKVIPVPPTAPLRALNARWLCVPNLTQHAALIDLMGEHPTLWLDHATQCGLGARAKDDSVWIVGLAAQPDLSSPAVWSWLRPATFEQGRLPLDSFRVAGWSDDGRWLAYATSLDFSVVGSATLHLMDTQTWQSRPVIEDVVATAYLSPDGNWLFAQRAKGNRGTTIMVATDGSRVSEQPLVSSWPVLTGPVLWSPDSRAVVFKHALPQARGTHNVIDVMGTDGRLQRRFEQPPTFGDFARSAGRSAWTTCQPRL
jgi:Tol biopolymer transport system component